MLGVLLFLFIPLVLFLFVQHPEPIGVSLAAGVVLMVGHRLLARPYMERVLSVKCVWCNRALAPGAGEVLEMRSGDRILAARCCSAHRRPATKFFAFLYAWRWPLRAGIFLPLFLLLITLAFAAFGGPAPLLEATALFKLVIGITVNVAAFGYFGKSPESPVAVPFPVHNFFLLGVRNLLWIFRLIGLWWIWQGLRFFLAA